MSAERRQVEELYRAHGRPLLAYLARCLGSPQQAEDLLHETFVRALTRLDRLAAAVSPASWLFGIARHLALTARRRRRPTQALSEAAAAPSAEEDPRLEAMRAALARLPGVHREALELRLRHELSYEEIAEVLGIPVGTVRSRLHHAVRQLRETMGETSETGGRAEVQR